MDSSTYSTLFAISRAVLTPVLVEMAMLLAVTTEPALLAVEGD